MTIAECLDSRNDYEQQQQLLSRLRYLWSVCGPTIEMIADKVGCTNQNSNRLDRKTCSRIDLLFEALKTNKFGLSSELQSQCMEFLVLDLQG